MKLKATDIRQVWDDVQPGLQVIKNRFNPEWRTEDIYADCVSGNATLYMADGGFFVMRVDVERFTGQSTLFIWIVYGKAEDEWESYLDEIETLARSVGAKSISFESPRKGYQKKGFEIENIKYRRLL